jgi:hypothetical protein
MGQRDFMNRIAEIQGGHDDRWSPQLREPLLVSVHLTVVVDALATPQPKQVLHRLCSPSEVVAAQHKPEGTLSGGDYERHPGTCRRENVRLQELVALLSSDHASLERIIDPVVYELPRQGQQAAFPNCGDLMIEESGGVICAKSVSAEHLSEMQLHAVAELQIAGGIMAAARSDRELFSELSKV